MNIPTLAPGCLEHLKSLKELFVTLAPQIAFCFALSQTAHPSLQPPYLPERQRDGSRLRGGELLNGLRATRKMGVDVPPEQIARGKERFPHLDLRPGSGETAILPEGPFDVIIRSHVLMPPTWSCCGGVYMQYLMEGPAASYQCLQHALASAAWLCQTPQACGRAACQ